jgi:60 kDa SS-A/Ro ribonucleoprotein
MKTNIKAVCRERTHEGATAFRINAGQQLRRSVMACLLWEDSFYESGETIADRIKNTIPEVKPEEVARIAIEAREKMKLRHVPLLLVREMARLKSHKHLVGETLSRVIQRPDELSEFLSIYWKEKRQPLSAQVKIGLAQAFQKFSEYQLAKYNQDGQVKLRDVLFLSHAKPKDGDQESVWKRLIDGSLVTPDTWEVSLSAGADKKGTWERLMAENKLGALAFIRNLRNMKEVGIEKSVVSKYAQTIDLSRVLPFRFVAAAKAAPSWEDICDSMLLRAAEQQEKIRGKTIIVVDVSGSMYGGRNISKKSDMTRVEAAGALAAIVRESCEDARIYATAGSDVSRTHATAECPNRRGMALVETFTKGHYASTLGGGGIFLKQCLDFIKETEGFADRLIILTDEQDCDHKANPQTADAFGRSNYLINVSCEKNGIGYGKFTHIDGWSEAVLEYIRSAESEQ